MPRKIFHIKSTLSESQRHPRELHGIRRSRCARCNGVTTLRMRLPGKEKKSWKQNFQVSFLICPNLGDEIYFKGGRFVTPSFFQNK
jgi:hypothetical protein